MGITMFISLYVTRLILNSLGASDFGIYNIVGGAISMLGFLNSAMASATQRFMSYSEGEGNLKKEKSIFNVSIILHFLIAIIAGIALVIAGYFFFHGILNIPHGRIFAAKVVYGSLIVSTMFTVMTVPYDAAMNAHENMRYYALVGILESFLKLAVAFACVYTLKDKLIVYGVLMACIPLISLTIMRIYCHRHYEECITAPRKYWNKGLMKEMTSFAGWNFLNTVSSVISQYGLGLVLNHFWGTVLNAAQGIANQISGQLMAFSNTMLKSLNPVIVKSEGSGDSKLMLKASLLGCKYAYMLLIVFAIPFMLETPYILKLWLKNIPQWGIVFCQLQLVRSIIEQLTITLGSAISAQGNIKGLSTFKSILGLQPIFITAIFFYFRYPPYLMYLFWIFFTGILGGYVSLFYVRKLCHLKYSEYCKMVLFPCLSLTTVMLIIGYLPQIFLPMSFCRLVITIMITTICMVLFSWEAIIGREEKEIIKSICFKLLHRKH
jgi:O-antigen/teichoic acid export membrane protein